MRRRFDMCIFGYVVMPEHVHLLLSEPEKGSLADAIHYLKLSFSKRAKSVSQLSVQLKDAKLGHPGSFDFEPGYGTNNHATGFSYDSVGNVLGDGLNSYTYDFQGRPLTVTHQTSTVSFIYDAFGRVAEEDSTGSVTHVLYQPDGSRFATINNSSIQNYFMPMVNGMVEVFNASGNQYIRHADWQGSSRLATDGGGNAVYSVAYAPYGETYVEKGSVDRFFTGNTQDAVKGSTGLYDFLFRQNSAAQGRWLVPDPAGVAAVDITNPQTWNRYAYVGNNPLSNVDPLGLDCTVVGSGESCGDSGTPFISVTSTAGASLWDFWGNLSYGTLNPYRFMLLPLDGPGEGRGGGRRPQPKPQPTKPVPTKGNCTAQRILSGIQGATNLAFAAQKGLALPGAVAIAGAAGGAPGAVVGIYGTVSITGQAVAGVGQLYSAFTGNYGMAAKVTQYGNIMSGPASGFWTLASGGTAASAEQRAGIESIALAGAGAVNSFLAQNLGGIIATTSDALNSWVGLTPGASGGCGSTQ